jgi:hypothetical protein
MTTYAWVDEVCVYLSVFNVFFSLGKANRGVHRCYRGGLGCAAEGPRPSMHAAGFEPGRMRSSTGSHTNRAMLSLLKCVQLITLEEKIGKAWPAL